MLKAQPPISQLLLNWDHDDVVRMRLAGPQGVVEGVAPHQALQDLCDGSAWTLVAGDLVLVRESSEIYRVRGLQQRIDLRVPRIEVANALARLG